MFNTHRNLRDLASAMDRAPEWLYSLLKAGGIPIYPGPIGRGVGPTYYLDEFHAQRIASWWTEHRHAFETFNVQAMAVAPNGGQGQVDFAAMELTRRAQCLGAARRAGFPDSFAEAL